MRLTGRHRGFSLVELLVVITIVATLIAITLPAIDMLREASRATTCRHRLREVTFATLQFETAKGAFPPARIVPAREGSAAASSSTWLVRIMPFLDQDVVADRWIETRDYASQEDSVRGAMVAEFLCPSRRSFDQALANPGKTADRVSACGCFLPGRMSPGGAVSDFAGNHGTPTDRGDPVPLGAAGPSTGTIVTSEPLPGTARWRDRVRVVEVSDGTTHTLLVGEKHVPRNRLCTPPDDGPAYDGTEFFGMSRVGGVGAPLGAGPDDDTAGMGGFVFGGPHPGVCNAAFADGRIARLSTAISPEVLDRLCNRHDGSIAESAARE